MSVDIRGITDGRFIGEYVDDGVVPAGMKAGQTESAPTRLVASYVDAATAERPLREFTILLTDGRTAAVRGHALKHLPAATIGERDSYGIIVRAADREELVAVFRSSDVSGIFHGELRVAPTVA